MDEDGIKVEDDKSYQMKLESDDIGEMEGNELDSSGEYQFVTEGEMAVDSYAEEEARNQKDDVIESYVIGSGSQTLEAVSSNTYVTSPIDDVGHGEQFLTIPRGKTQITVCDNGEIVYTDESMLDNFSIESSTRQKSITAADDGQTVYYQTQDDANLPEEEHMEEDDGGQFIQQLTDVEQIEGDAFVAKSASPEYITEHLVDEEPDDQEFQARAIAETVLNRSDMKKFIAIQQDNSKGLKRSIPVSNKNFFTKVFIQGSPGTPQGPIKIIGSLPGSVVQSRTVTVAQAQRMGLIPSTSKMQQSGIVSSPGRMLVKKVTSSAGASVLAVKSPTKILPAPPPNKTRIPTLGMKGPISPGNIMPVRTNIPVSQLKMLTAISSPTTQVKPLAVTRNITTVNETRSPNRVLIRPASSVLSSLSGQITRMGPNTTFQPVQIKGKQSVQYVRLVGSGTSSGAFTGIKPKVIKTIAPNSSVPKSLGTATVVGNKIILPMSSEVEQLMQLKPSNVVPMSMKGKAFQAARQTVKFADDPVDQVVSPEDDKSETQSETEELCDKENLDDGQSVLEANGIRPRKPCNCSKTQCLKLYCECFANGEFCFQCNCTNCYNNIEHEDERQLSIQSCLERNPLAFRPKFQIRETEEDLRNKGCNCRRSGCFKNYCECFEAKLPCTKVCKCQGCKNTEEELEANRKRESGDEEEDENSTKTPKFMSPSLAEALCQCILAQAEKAESNGDDAETTERKIIEEFGQCIVQIIGNRTKRDAR